MHQRRSKGTFADPELRSEAGRQCLVDFADGLIEK
jgi:hypothetical protein